MMTPGSCAATTRNAPRRLDVPRGFTDAARIGAIADDAERDMMSISERDSRWSSKSAARLEVVRVCRERRQPRRLKPCRMGFTPSRRGRKRRIPSKLRFAICDNTNLCENYNAASLPVR